MTPFETALLHEVARIRRTFADRDVGECNITIRASGRTDSEEMKITFSLDGSYNDREVTGNSLDACLDEFFRRKGWQKAHDYLALPNVPPPPMHVDFNGDDVPADVPVQDQ